MKLVVAYIRPEKLTDVKTALARREVHRLSVTNAMGCGDSPVIHEQYRGSDLEIDMHNRVRLEIAVNDAFVDATVEAIRTAGHTGRSGDGIIMLFHIERAWNIATGATEGEAIA